ncbi:MAG: class I SAM-dependent methyltransferase [Thaumarchaeota archaeon]|nr:class I SAM-dependent methyltransferase [Nitrososphaerota archaeon]
MHKRALYSQLAKYYDRVYWWKDYGQEVDFLTRTFRRYGVNGRRILEVACGTGNHTKILVSKGYRVTGVDVSEESLRIARRKVKGGARFLKGDMRDLDEVLGGRAREFDAAICMFSSISYNLTISDLRRTLKGMHDHLAEGGVVIFDTHFTKKGFRDGYRGESTFDDGRVIGARISLSRLRGEFAELSFSYLIKDGPKVITLRDDVHRLGLFDVGDFRRVMQEVGFGEVNVFVNWTFRRARLENQFMDVVFVGRKSSMTQPEIAKSVY